MDKKPKKICFVGGPSTGKTTLANYLAKELAKNNYSAELVSEFARDYIAQKGAIGPEDQLYIVKGQKEREKFAAERSPEFIVCDVPSYLSHVYFHFLNSGKTLEEDEAERLKMVEQELWKEVSVDINNYDFVFYIPPELAPEEDGVRLYTDQIENISSRIDDFLHSNNIEHHELRGTVEERAAKALRIIGLA